MIRRRDLLKALGQEGVSDWVIVERTQEVGFADDVTRVLRAERRFKWQLTVHSDAPTGRGSAHVTLDAADADAEAAVGQAVAIARAALGPAWVTRPPAAPARVKLDDPTLGGKDILELTAGIAKAIPRPAGTTITASTQLLREHVTVESRAGLRTQWDATHVRADMVVAANDRSIAILREARRVADLGLAGAVDSAIADLRALSNAGAVTPGVRALLLRPDAMLHGGLGVWAVFVPQADAVVERQGLTRYRERTPIAKPGPQPATLTVTSDGARDYGLLSAPINDQGDAIRRFPLVERGVAVGLGLSQREASLRGRDPNGGVRNLVVERGTWAGEIDATRPVLEVKRLGSLSLDPYTGDAAIELALAIEHDKGVQRVVAGGSIRIDMIAALATAARSATVISRGAYVGPDAVLIENADVLA